MTPGSRPYPHMKPTIFLYADHLLSTLGGYVISRRLGLQAQNE